ncbi:MAG: zf-TFIIB domain-containing protein [Nanoarchaeota archaeon]|nr:zf-TFIIB domain-containing protein [Acidobacteriota bacterium]MBU4352962.1 zf-TFIIB domain-containing protein [Nanoarchaeota archaeon]
MKCPNCETVDLSISERKNIEIDFCPKCRGVWLDKGELDKMIELSTESSNKEHTPREHHKEYKEDNYYKKKKKKSSLGDLFDFG